MNKWNFHNFFYEFEPTRSAALSILSHKQTNKQTNKQKNNSAKKTHFGSTIYHYIWVTRFQVLTIFWNSFNLPVWQVSQYNSVTFLHCIYLSCYALLESNYFQTYLVFYSSLAYFLWDKIPGPRKEVPFWLCGSFLRPLLFEQFVYFRISNFLTQIWLVVWILQPVNWCTSRTYPEFFNEATVLILSILCDILSQFRHCYWLQWCEGTLRVFN